MHAAASKSKLLPLRTASSHQQASVGASKDRHSHKRELYGDAATARGKETEQTTQRKQAQKLYFGVVWESLGHRPSLLPFCGARDVHEPDHLKIVTS